MRGGGEVWKRVRDRKLSLRRAEGVGKIYKSLLFFSSVTRENTLCSANSVAGLIACFACSITSHFATLRLSYLTTLNCALTHATLFLKGI